MREACFYSNPDCHQTATHAVSEWYVDMWVDGYWSCDEHLSYILDCIQRKWHNRAEVRKL
jgi:hypothetical protein